MNKPVIPKQLELAGTVLSPAEAAKVTDIIDESDFWDTDDEDIVVKPKPGIAVYQNKAGDVVIRTQNVRDPYEDHYAFVQPEALPAVIQALKGRLP